MKKVIVYYSKYGSTKDYAEWIAQDTGAELVPFAQARKLDLAAYDAIAFGCPFYAFKLKIAGYVKSRASQFAGKKVAFFAVGAEPPESPEVHKRYEACLPEEVRSRISLFFLPGRVAMGKMGFLDRTVMRMMKAKDFDHTSRAAIAPIVEFLRG